MKQLIILLVLILNSSTGFSQTTAKDGSMEFGDNVKAESESDLDVAVKEFAKKLAKKITAVRQPEPTRDIPVRRPPRVPDIPHKKPSESQVTTNVIYSSTNKKAYTDIKTSRMANLGFFYLLEDKKFSDNFSVGTFGDNNGPYYRMPYNSWNDPFYLVLSFDWELGFLKSIDARAGWCIGFNFAGSGSKDDSIKVKSDSGLGSADKSPPNYVIYNDFKFPVMMILRIQPISISIFELYTGGGAGGYLGIFTYNELEGKTPSSLEKNDVKTFFPVGLIYKVFIGISFETIEALQEIFLEVSYQFAKNPIVTSDWEEYNRETGSKVAGHKRSISFQISGLFLGFGFRY